MQTLSDDQKAFLKEMLKSEGWKIFSAIATEHANILRRQATEQKVELEDRLWNSALATGYDEALNLPVIISK